MTHPRYQTRAWRAARKSVLARDRRVCQIRLPGCLGVANSVDHKVRPEDGGATYDESNLQAACRPCNTAKRNMELAARAAGRENHRPTHGGGWSRDWTGHGLWQPSDTFEEIMAKEEAYDAEHPPPNWRMRP